MEAPSAGLLPVRTAARTPVTTAKLTTARPKPKRDAQRAPLVENVHAAVVALAEFVTETIETVRRNEDTWLAELTERAPDMEEREAEARRLLAEAREQTWLIAQVGRWVKTAADDAALGQQPAPQPGPPPPNWVPSEREFTRNWSELQSWNKRSPEDDAAVREFHEGPPPQSPPPQAFRCNLPRSPHAPVH